ncbi:hypothetical protein GUITHDRAFT_105072 [Guillardia theta CCMP2712]|uniref:TOG domain-containing protein n=1 Tax=Guillardia theta (strain CCMP2712) TaxID=905079 RepID=L1JKY1_GUITC|nr:hypothetical protein GUITHDRAFT_105072 [Guillardia theta CCMP2712]EKX48987.1 hypothetical protein GUITHDRAFT_105072 [Guillardia theta CCMP2712]|eukprot:XP_005835967.1 hypothetical protein GUITHDRAFT_105072 [Guillardia theta CCMP2712]
MAYMTMEMSAESPEPRVVYSEKDLARHFESILQDLLNKSHDNWNKRCDALRLIRALVKGGATDFPTFASLVHNARQVLADCIADLRSVLVKEACKTVTLLAESMQQSFAPVAEIMITSCLKQIPVTIQVISEAAFSCLQSIFTHTHSGRLIPKLLEGMKSKAAGVKAKSLSCILIILQKWAWSDMEKQFDQLEDVLVSSLSDAQGDVRLEARRCVAEVCERFKDRGGRMMRNLDVSMQKKILEEAACSSPVAKPRSGSRPATAGAVRVRTAVQEAARPAAHEEPTRPSTTMAAAQRKEPPVANERTHMTQGPRRVGAGLDSTGRSGAGAGARAGAGAGAGAGASIKTTCRRVPLDVLAANPSSHDQMKSESARAWMEDGRDKTWRSAGQGGGRKEEGNQVLHAVIPRALSEEELNGCLVEASNSLWSLREGSLLKLAGAIVASPSSRALSSAANRIADLISERLGDAHHKVQQAALVLLDAFAAHMPATLAPCLDLVLPRLMQRLCDKKEEVRSASVLLLRRLHESCGSQVTLMGMVKALDAAQAPVKSACLQHLISSYSVFAPFIASCPSQARNLFLKLLPLSIDKVLELRRSSVQALVQLYVLAPLPFYEALMKLPGEQQAAIKKSLLPSLPSLDREAAAYARTKKLSPEVAAVSAHAISSCCSPQNKEVRGEEGWEIHSHAAAAQEDDEEQEESKSYQPCNYEEEEEEAMEMSSKHASESQTVRPVERTPRKRQHEEEGGEKGRADSWDDRGIENQEANRQPRVRGSPWREEEKSMSSRELLTSILSQLNSSLSRQDCEASLEHLRRLAAFSEASRERGGGSLVQLILLLLKGAAQAGMAEVQMASLKLLDASLQEEEDVDPLAQVVLRELLESVPRSKRSVAAQAEEVTARMMTRCNPQRSMGMLAQALEEGNARGEEGTGSTIPVVIRLLEKQAGRTPRSLLEPHVPLLLPLLSSALNHSSADVRKSVVMCLVELHRQLGQEMLVELDGLLTAAQLKLVRIYIDKARGGGGGGGAAALC